MKLSVALDWLVENSILGDDDKAFVLDKVVSFLKVSSEVAAGKPSGSQKWVGIVPCLRLVHCITDEDDAKASFLKSFSVRTRKKVANFLFVFFVCTCENSLSLLRFKLFSSSFCGSSSLDLYNSLLVHCERYYSILQHLQF